MSKYSFNVGILDNIDGYKLKSIEPDNNGFYDVILGCLGIPSRNGVVYETESILEAMHNTTSRFVNALREGNLHGEWGHPVLPAGQNQEFMQRLFQIDETRISHLFGNISIDTDNVIKHKDTDIITIRGKVKPVGPYGKYLEESFRDPYNNTAFSMRTLCSLSQGPDTKYSYRNVQVMITFDAVHCPGWEYTSKRFASGMESFREIGMTSRDLNKVVEYDLASGMQSNSMLTMADVERLRVSNLHHEVKITGKQSFSDNNGDHRNAAMLAYRG